MCDGKMVLNADSLFLNSLEKTELIGVFANELYFEKLTQAYGATWTLHVASEKVW